MSTPELPGRRADPDARAAVRIGDREREQAVAHLGRAFGEGRLDLAEYDERVASAYHARTASDLLHLTADLPLATGDHQGASATQVGDLSRPRNRGRAGTARGISDEADASWVWGVWGTYAAVVTLCVVIWLIVSLTGRSGAAYPWPLWVAGPWGALLIFQTIGARAARRNFEDNSNR